MSVHTGTSSTVRADIRRFVPSGPVLRGGLLAFLVGVPGATGCTELGATGTPAPGSTTRAQVEQLLASVRVIAARPYPGGYERGCEEGQGCVFGRAWSDDYDGPDGHDGCDTRNNVLARQLTGVTFRAGTRECVVTSGVLDDPYTGRRLTFAKADARDVQIDHVYPLAAAWDMGAASWSLERRVIFANDVETNLLATDAETNQAKGDSTPAE